MSASSEAAALHGAANLLIEAASSLFPATYQEDYFRKELEMKHTYDRQHLSNDPRGLTHSMSRPFWQTMSEGGQIGEETNGHLDNEEEQSLRITCGLPEGEALVTSFSCAIHRSILLHGRLYIWRCHVCFWAEIFGVTTMVVLALADIVSASRVAVDYINPGMMIATETEEHFFASFFGQRDFVFHIIDAMLKMGKVASVGEYHHMRSSLSCIADNELITSAASSAHDDLHVAEAKALVSSLCEIDTDEDTLNGIQSVFNLHPDEVLVANFSCAVRRSVMQHGRMYILLDKVCFRFSTITALEIPLQQVEEIYCKWYDVINAAFVIKTSSETHIFLSFFGQRNFAFYIVYSLWLLNQKCPDQMRLPGAFKRPKSVKQKAVDVKNQNALVSQSGLSTESMWAALAQSQAMNSEKSCRDGLQNELLEQTLPCSLEVAVYQLFLEGEASFLRELKEAQGITELSIDRWTLLDHGQGLARTLRCSAPVASRLSPVSSTRLVETHRCHQLPDGSVCLQVEQRLIDIPYADYFAVHCHWRLSQDKPHEDAQVNNSCLAGIGAPGCKLRVSSELDFTRSTWLQSTIEANTLDEQRILYKVCGALALAHTNATTASSSSSSGAGKAVRDSAQCAAGAAPQRQHSSRSSCACQCCGLRELLWRSQTSPKKLQ